MDKPFFSCFAYFVVVSLTSVATLSLFAGRSDALLDAAIAEVVREDAQADEAWRVLASDGEALAFRERLRARMQEAIGPLPARCDLDVRVMGTVDFPDYRIEKLVFASRPNHHITAHLFLPKDAERPYPAILLPCGHDRKGKLSRNHQRAGVLAAREGFAALICDPLDQGERLQHPSQPEGCVHGHVNAGLRAHLLGWGFAQFRVWDLMRGLDVLESRSDIDKTRIGVAGMSGGGTLTAYLFLLENRIKAACPMGFITDLTRLVNGRGPQDSEQIVFGQLAFGLNHLSLLLGGFPRPVCPGFTYDDFFPFAGSQETFADAAALYRRFGYADRIDHLECPGRHGWYESEKLGQLLWMRRWLNGDKAALPFDRVSLNALNVKQDAADLDYALANASNGLCLAEGVMKLPNERSVYDIMAEEANRLNLTRGRLDRETVRRILGEPLPVAPDLVRAEARRQGYWFKRGGEDEQAAAVLAWLGRNYVANRVAEMVAQARAYRTVNAGRRMILKAEGADVVAAAHAAYLEPELFASVEMTNPPPSWRAALQDPALRLDFRTVVFGALKAYDWTDLLEDRTRSLNLIPSPQKVVVGGGSVSTNLPVAFTIDRSIKKEGYLLTIAKEGVRIASSDEAGAFYARQTLRQLVQPDGTYPCVTIADAPAYQWRGYLLDCSRHFFEVKTLKQVLDCMAEYKFNIFHWHLVDDQGWRFPTRKYPKLKTIGATRPRPDWLGAEHIYDDATGDYGPFGYSEEEIRDIVDYASARHIKVVPEMEIPGHSREVVTAYPEFYCENADATAYTNMNNIGLCLGNDATIQFFKDCLDEYCETFPDSEIIHIGGDECPRENWKKCPKCQKRMRDLGLRSEDELQAWCTRVMTEHLAKKGRRAIGWNEIVEGGLASNTLVMCWNENGRKAAIQAIRQGNPVVITPQEKCYFNMPKEGPRNYVPPTERAFRWAHAYDPCFKIDARDHNLVLGGECCTWGERVIDIKDIEWAIFPLFFASSEALWRGPSKPALKDFIPRAEEHNRRMRARGHHVAPVPRK